MEYGGVKIRYYKGKKIRSDATCPPRGKGTSDHFPAGNEREKGKLGKVTKTKQWSQKTTPSSRVVAGLATPAAKNGKEGGTDL